MSDYPDFAQGDLLFWAFLYERSFREDFFLGLLSKSKLHMTYTLQLWDDVTIRPWDISKSCKGPVGAGFRIPWWPKRLRWIPYLEGPRGHRSRRWATWQFLLWLVVLESCWWWLEEVVEVIVATEDFLETSIKEETSKSRRVSAAFSTIVFTPLPEKGWTYPDERC